jgi:hypothetical protein
MSKAIRTLATLVVLSGLPFAAALAQEAIDWTPYADERTVTVYTTDEDGGERKTTVWLVVVEGQGYIRTGATRWGGNVERKPAIVLEVNGEAMALRVEFVKDQAVRQQVKDAFREKYGFPDWIMSPMRGRNPKIMRLLVRAEDEEQVPRPD